MKHGAVGGKKEKKEKKKRKKHQENGEEKMKESKSNQNTKTRTWDQKIETYAVLCKKIINIALA